MYQVKLTLQDGKEFISIFNTFDDLTDYIINHQQEIQIMEMDTDESSDNNRPTLRS